LNAGSLQLEPTFRDCPSLRLIIIPDVKVVETEAFAGCRALTDVKCGKLETIEDSAFSACESLRIINLPSVENVGEYAFGNCNALTDVIFGGMLDFIDCEAFYKCRSLDQITIPLKDAMISDDRIFLGCEKLKRVNLVERAVLRDTIAALQLEDWQIDVNKEFESINQILSDQSAGETGWVGIFDMGGKALVVRDWMRSVLDKIVQYKTQHRRVLNEAATTLELALLPKDIVMKNVLPFLELPSFSFDGED